MKKQLLVIYSAVALALSSCGGDYVPKDVPETFVTFVKGLPASPDKTIYFAADQHKDSSDITYKYFAYPNSNNGGYSVVFQRCYNEGYSVLMQYKTFVCKDGEISEADNFLPVADVGLRINSSKISEREADYREFMAYCNDNCNDLSEYVMVTDRPEVYAAPQNFFEGRDWSDRLGDLLQYNYFMDLYKWNGEKFVKHHRLADLMASLPATPDKPFYHWVENHFNDEEMYSNLELYYAFPLKAGGYMGIYMQTGEPEGEAYFCRESTFVYANGEFKKVDGVLPVPDISKLFNPKRSKRQDALAEAVTDFFNENPSKAINYHIQDNGDMYVDAAGNGIFQWGEVFMGLMRAAVYKWDGEKFVFSTVKNPLD